MRYPHHPAADLFPMLAADELRELADDIARNGLHEPVWLVEHEGETKVLDGRNRLAACELAGIEPRTRMYSGGDPIGFALSLNLKRRHLNEGQKGFVALKVLALYEAEARERQVSEGRKAQRTDLTLGATWPQGSKPAPKMKTELRQPRARDRAADSVGVSGRTVARAKRVDQQAPDLADKVKDGSLELGRADRIIRDREAEVAETALPPKDARVTQRLAEKAGIPAFSVSYQRATDGEDIEAFHVRQLAPVDSAAKQMSSSEYAQFLWSLRELHHGESPRCAARSRDVVNGDVA